eukprot:g7076.t1
MEDLVFSPGGSQTGRSPRLRFRGGLSQLVGLNEKMNRTLSELKEGQFDHAKGHEAVQALQSKLYRLQDHFDDNIAEVQQSIVEHSAFYANNPQVLGGMVKLTEVLGLASVLLAQKADAIQELLESYLAPLEQQYKAGKDSWDQLEQEVKTYRLQVNNALERGKKYENEVTMHLKNAKETMRKKLVEDVDRRIAETSQRNHELQRQVKALEFQLKRQETARAMGSASSSVITKAHGSGPPESAALRNIEMVEKVNELETLVEQDKGAMLTPMIRDACNYLRTLLAMKDDDDATPPPNRQPLPREGSVRAGGATSSSAGSQVGVNFVGQLGQGQLGQQANFPQLVGLEQANFGQPTSAAANFGQQQPNAGNGPLSHQMNPGAVQFNPTSSTSTTISGTPNLQSNNMNRMMNPQHHQLTGTPQLGGSSCANAGPGPNQNVGAGGPNQNLTQLNLGVAAPGQGQNNMGAGANMMAQQSALSLSQNLVQAAAMNLSGPNLSVSSGGGGMNGIGIANNNNMGNMLNVVNNLSNQHQQSHSQNQFAFNQMPPAQGQNPQLLPVVNNTSGQQGMMNNPSAQLQQGMTSGQLQQSGNTITVAGMGPMQGVTVGAGTTVGDQMGVGSTGHLPGGNHNLDHQLMQLHQNQSHKLHQNHQNQQQLPFGGGGQSQSCQSYNNLSGVVNQSLLVQQQNAGMMGNTGTGFPGNKPMTMFPNMNIPGASTSTGGNIKVQQQQPYSNPQAQPNPNGNADGGQQLSGNGSLINGTSARPLIAGKAGPQYNGTPAMTVGNPGMNNQIMNVRTGNNGMDGGGGGAAPANPNTIHRIDPPHAGSAQHPSTDRTRGLRNANPGSMGMNAGSHQNANPKGGGGGYGDRQHGKRGAMPRDDGNSYWYHGGGYRGEDRYAKGQEQGTREQQQGNGGRGGSRAENRFSENRNAEQAAALTRPLHPDGGGGSLPQGGSSSSASSSASTSSTNNHGAPFYGVKNMINCPKRMARPGGKRLSAGPVIKRPVPLATPCLVVPWGGRVTNCANLTHFGDGDDEDDELAEILKSPRRNMQLRLYYPHTSLSVGFDQQQEEYDRTGRLYQSFQGYASAYAMVGGNAPRKKAQALADAKRWWKNRSGFKTEDSSTDELAEFNSVAIQTAKTAPPVYYASGTWQRDQHGNLIKTYPYRHQSLAMGHRAQNYEVPPVEGGASFYIGPQDTQQTVTWCRDERNNPDTGKVFELWEDRGTVRILSDRGECTWGPGPTMEQYLESWRTGGRGSGGRAEDGMGRYREYCYPTGLPGPGDPALPHQSPPASSSSSSRPRRLETQHSYKGSGGENRFSAAGDRDPGYQKGAGDLLGYQKGGGADLGYRTVADGGGAYNNPSRGAGAPAAEGTQLRNKPGFPAEGDGRSQDPPGPVGARSPNSRTGGGSSSASASSGSNRGKAMHYATVVNDDVNNVKSSYNKFNVVDHSGHQLQQGKAGAASSSSNGGEPTSSGGGGVRSNPSAGGPGGGHQVPDTTASNRGGGSRGNRGDQEWRDSRHSNVSSSWYGGGGRHRDDGPGKAGRARGDGGAGDHRGKGGRGNL